MWYREIINLILDAGSDVGNISTTATLDGDFYVLNGTKSWVTSGTVGKAAIVFATVDRKLNHKGDYFCQASIWKNYVS